MVTAPPSQLTVASTATSRRRLAVLSVSCVAAGALLYVLAVHTALGQRIDQTSVSHFPWQRTSSGDAKHYEDGAVATIAAVGLLGVALARRRWRLVAVLGASAGAAVVAAGVLRRSILDRPDLVSRNWLLKPSFPSGHATAAITIGLAFTLVCPWNKWVRRSLALAIAAVTDSVVLFIPIHRTSDVIAGNLVGLAFIAGALAVFGATRDLTAEGAPQDRPESFVRRLVSYEALAVVATGLALLLMTRLARRSDFTLGDYGAEFPLAILAAVVSAAAVLAVFETAVASVPIGRLRDRRSTPPAP